jgi:hypothetical protein
MTNLHPVVATNILTCRLGKQHIGFLRATTFVNSDACCVPAAS